MPRNIDNDLSRRCFEIFASRRFIFRSVWLCGFLILFALTVGCQRSGQWDLSPVQGTVTRGGQSLAGVEVVFLTDGHLPRPRSSGVTDAEGRYELRMDDGARGAAPGRYRIILIDQRERFEKSIIRSRKKSVGSGNGSKPSKGFPNEYVDFAKRPLRAEVGTGAQALNFDLP